MKFVIGVILLCYGIMHSFSQGYKDTNWNIIIIAFQFWKTLSIDLVSINESIYSFLFTSLRFYIFGIQSFELSNSCKEWVLTTETSEY